MGKEWAKDVPPVTPWMAVLNADEPGVHRGGPIDEFEKFKYARLLIARGEGGNGPKVASEFEGQDISLVASNGSSSFINSMNSTVL